MIVSIWSTAGWAADDVLFTDFEGDQYGDWVATGTAFGGGPAEGTLSGQMKVSGYQGKRLANSYAGGDKSTGTLSSPEFTIDQPYIKFLIGGGGFAGKTCMQLLVDEKVVREATGTNTESGGSEALSPDFWDVADLLGQKARIKIVDDETGGWGHITVDHIAASSIKPETHAFDRDVLVDKTYLLIPIENGAPKIDLEVSVDGKPIRKYSTELATDPSRTDWFAYFDLSAHQEETAHVSASRAVESVFDSIALSDSIPVSAANYDEPLRPQFHFSQRVGWINDPNGMVYLDGEWHLYFQHNPVGWAWGNMTWGHAVTKDLVHWEQLPNVLFPGVDAVGACFSGGAVIDHDNTSGWKTGDTDLMVAFLTDTGAGEAVAFSNDRGRSFTWYEGNPVIKHKGRDPKVVWYTYDTDDSPIDDQAKEMGGHWAMVVYDESETHGENTAFYTSTDLKAWKFQSHLSGYFECPELFELPIEGESGESRWVTFGADGKYAIGDFDGRTFTPQHEGKHQLFYGSIYASQTFDNAPDDRRVMIGWMRLDSPGMPFNQTFTFPHQLTLHQTSAGLRMFSAPADEIKSIYTKSHSAGDAKLGTLSIPVGGDLFDIEATFELGDATNAGLDIGGNRVDYNVEKQTWQDAHALATGNSVSIRVLVDRTQIEIWGNGGEVSITQERKQRGAVNEIIAYAEGGAATLKSIKVHELKSAWRE